MSTFITKADYGDLIQEGILDQITEFDDAKLDVAEARAISLMKGHLSARYDVDAIFSATGSNRDPVILMYAVAIALYLLHERINPRQIPEFRKERYNAAMDWLEAVKNEEINPPGLPVPSTGDKDYIRYGSNPRRSNHI